jgi:hypothetical protein
MGPNGEVLAPSPTALLLASTTVTAAPFARPEIVQGDALQRDDATTTAELTTVTKVDVMGDPFAAPSVHVTVTWPSPPTSELTVGALGTPSGVTAAEGGEAQLIPVAFDAVTTNVAGTPSGRPWTMQLVVTVTQVWPPG